MIELRLSHGRLPCRTDRTVQTRHLLPGRQSSVQNHPFTNILDVTQSIFEDDIFAMVMMVDISKLNCPLPALSDRLNALTRDAGLVVHVMHEDIFNSMHRI